MHITFLFYEYLYTHIFCSTKANWVIVVHWLYLVCMMYIHICIHALHYKYIAYTSNGSKWDFILPARSPVGRKTCTWQLTAPQHFTYSTYVSYHVLFIVLFSNHVHPLYPIIMNLLKFRFSWILIAISTQRHVLNLKSKSCKFQTYFL